MPPNSAYRRAERGNAFIFILMGIALFAALAFTISRGMQTQTTTTMNARDIELSASDILTYAQRVSRAVDRIRGAGISENDISFESDLAAGYDHTPAADDKAKVFSASGGHIAWQKPAPGMNNGTDWIFTGGNFIANIGPTTDSELMMILTNMNAQLCKRLNEMIGVANPSDDAPSDNDGVDLTKFQGTFANTEQIGDVPDIDGAQAACYKDTLASPATYNFYYVLIPR